MENKLSQRAALVTGGAKRIGKAVALQLAATGYDIALHYHTSRDAAENTAAEVKARGVKCVTFACDLANEKETAGLIARVQKDFPNIDLLINGASVFVPSTLEQESVSDFQKNTDVHVKAPYILMQAFAKLIKKGQIINFLDTNVAKNKTAHFSYLLSKKALLDLTKMAAVDLAPNIRVNAIAPGFILPPQGKEGTFVEERVQGIPLKRKGELAHIAQTVSFLVNNDYLTGQVIFVDGGEHLV